MAGKLTIDYSGLDRIVNQAFYPLLFAEERFLVVYGGRGSSKSTSMHQKVLHRLTTEPHHKIILFRKVARTCRHSVFAEMEELIGAWGLAPYFHIRRQEMEGEFVNNSQFLCLGLDDRKKLKSLRGVTSVVVEEATETEEADFTEINMIMRGACPSYRQAILIFNPENTTHWLYKRFFRKAPVNWRLHHSTHRDNPYLDDEYRRELEALRDIDPELYKVYCLGRWGTLHDLIYERWHVEPFDYRALAFETECFCMDFGYGVPTALLHEGFSGHRVRVTELVYRTELTSEELIEETWAAIPKEKRKLPIYCDSADPEAIETLRRAGMNAQPAVKDKNSVVNGIRCVKDYDLLISSDSVNVQKEIAAYKWRRDKTTNTLLDEPVKFQDHAMDALRMGIYTHTGGQGRSIIRKAYRVPKTRAGAY